MVSPSWTERAKGCGDISYKVFLVAVQGHYTPLQTSELVSATGSEASTVKTCGSCVQSSFKSIRLVVEYRMN